MKPQPPRQAHLIEVKTITLLKFDSLLLADLNREARTVAIELLVRPAVAGLAHRQMKVALRSTANVS